MTAVDFFSQPAVQDKFMLSKSENIMLQNTLFCLKLSRACYEWKCAVSCQFFYKCILQQVDEFPKQKVISVSTDRWMNCAYLHCYIMWRHALGKHAKVWSHDNLQEARIKWPAFVLNNTPFLIVTLIVLTILFNWSHWLFDMLI